MPTLKVDARESASNIRRVRALLEDDAEWDVRVDVYDTADYFVGNTFACEAKEVTDFHNSIKNGRIFQQAREMKENFSNPMVLLSLGPGRGKWEGLMHPRYGGVSPEAVRGAIASLFARREVPVAIVDEPVGDAVVRFARKAMKGEPVEYTPIRKRAKTSSRQKHLLVGLPGIGSEKANRILEVYENPLRALNRVRDWPHHIDGVGEKTVEKALDVLEGDER